ncbi:MAG TPA: amidohydrolase family protein [Xanthobacteraceae bacterium]
MPSARRIDVHFHTIPVFYQEAVIAAGLGPTRRSGYPPCSPEAALEMMDANGIDYAIASVSMPGVQFCEPGKAKALARRLNEHAAEQRARWPGRFGGFAIIPMRNADDAIAEIAYALDVLKLEGVCLFTNYDGTYLGDPLFDPVLEALNGHGAVVYTHPNIHPSSRTIPLKYPGFLMEYPFDTTRMAVHLILTGALDRFPGIKFILSHGGGTLPYLRWRIGSGPGVDEGLPQWPREKFADYFSRFWYDNAIACDPPATAAMKSIAGLDKVLFGTDWPFIPARLIAEQVATHVLPSTHTDIERAAIDRGNALKLWPHLATDSAHSSQSAAPIGA